MKVKELRKLLEKCGDDEEVLEYGMDGYWRPLRILKTVGNYDFYSANTE